MIKSEKKISEKKEPLIDKSINNGILPKSTGPRVRIKAKHRALFAEMQTNGAKITPAMIALEYSPNTVKTPGMLTRTKSWQALMAEHLPEDLVALRHSELLNKRARRNIKNSKGEVTEYDVDDGPDTPAVVKALELAYKLRGSFAAEKQMEAKSVIYNLFYKPEVREAMKSFEDNLKQQIANEANTEIKDVTYSETPNGGGENQG